MIYPEIGLDTPGEIPNATIFTLFEINSDDLGLTDMTKCVCAEAPTTLPTVIQQKHNFEEFAKIQQKKSVESHDSFH